MKSRTAIAFVVLFCIKKSLWTKLSKFTSDELQEAKYEKLSNQRKIPRNSNKIA